MNKYRLSKAQYEKLINLLQAASAIAPVGEFGEYISKTYSILNGIRPTASFASGSNLHGTIADARVEYSCDITVPNFMLARSLLNTALPGVGGEYGARYIKPALEILNSATMTITNTPPFPIVFRDERVR